MILLLWALGIIAAGGTAALSARTARRAALCGAGGAIAGCAVGLAAALRALLSPGAAPESVRLPWSVPGGAFYVELDALSAFFLIAIFGLSALAAWYGTGYLRSWQAARAHGPSWFFYNLLVAGMGLSVIARNGVLFLVAWEVMSLASFFLVTTEDEKASAREAGWTYLVAAHLGTAFLWVLFILLGRESGSLDFDRFGPPGARPPLHAGVLFLLAVVGFGTKAGFMPLHVWLPEAHPAAPSHVSAVMSGVMIKTGIYGLVRTLTWLGPPPAWWGWLMVAVGISSGVLGVLFALAQHDLKRLLAYHSVENIGIIALGLGVGLLGRHFGSPALAALGFAGALLHVLNHAVFKGLLFLGAGAVAHATGTREMEHLGGLLRRMPWTGATFLIGAAAISGLPPLNGFVSEFLIYLGAFRGAAALGTPAAAAALAAIAGLALIGGLAAACFAKAFGIVFLGEPRGPHAAHAHEPCASMRVPMGILAGLCAAIGLGAPVALAAAAPAVSVAAGLPASDVRVPLAEAGALLAAVAVGAAAIAAIVLLLAVARRALLAGRPVTEAGTWDCGYARPEARMQYTASSFAQPLTDLFGIVLRPRRAIAAPEGRFPARAAFATETADVAREGLYRPIFTGIGVALARLRWLQHGRVQIYVLYIALTLLTLLVWKLG